MNAIRFSRVFLSLFGSALLVILLLLFLLPFGTQAKSELSPTGVTRYVSPTGDNTGNVCTSSGFPCRTVQHAIDVSQDGDEVRVAQGVYTGTMAEPRSAGGTFSATVILTKNLSALLGGYSPDFSTRDPDINETTLNASDAPRKFVVFISNTTTLIDGFTMTGATGACPTDCITLQYNGGAVWIRNGAPTISHNRIQGNWAYYNGGGIYVGQNATPIIASNIIYSNTASFHEDGGGLGGGIYLSSGSAVITGNKIISNVADVEGGGIFVGWNVPASILSNTIAYNQVISTTGGRGGGVRTIGDTAIVNISHNEVYSNTTSGGGGSGFDIGSPAIVDSNYLHHNRSLNQSIDWGGAILVSDADAPTEAITLTNNIVIDNYLDGIEGINFGDVWIFNNTIARNWNGIWMEAWPTTPTLPFTATVVNNIVISNTNCGIAGNNGVTFAIDYNDAFNNSYSNYCDLANPPNGTHNISADPQFVNPSAGNYHLRFGSPAMNAGTSTNAPSYDKDGVKRPQMGRVDIGAYEVVAPFSVYLPVVLK